MKCSTYMYTLLAQTTKEKKRGSGNRVKSQNGSFRMQAACAPGGILYCLRKAQINSSSGRLATAAATVPSQTRNAVISSIASLPLFASGRKNHSSRALRNQKDMSWSSFLQSLPVFLRPNHQMNSRGKKAQKENKSQAKEKVPNTMKPSSNSSSTVKALSSNFVRAVNVVHSPSQHYQRLLALRPSPGLAGGPMVDLLTGLPVLRSGAGIICAD